MPNPRQDRFARPLLRKRFRHVAAALLSTALLFIGPAAAWAEESIVIDFVRHGQTPDNVADIISTSVPGGELTQTGQEEAQAVANVLAPLQPVGIYASELIRTQETAAPLATLLDLPVQVLPGLNEIGAGIYNGYPTDSLAGILWELPPVAWVLGLDFVPIPGSTDPNGMAFDESFSAAVQAIYDNTVSVASVNGNPTDVAFSSEGAIATWTLMNVNNPDFLLVLTQWLDTGQLLPNTGIVAVEGDPQDGWTLVSWNGEPVPPASLPTELFVDARDLIEAPQLAGYNIHEALLTGDPTTIVNAIQEGVDNVGTATLHFPVAVISDIVDAVLGTSSASTVADTSTDIQNAAANLGTELNLGTLPGGFSLDAPFSGFNLGDLSADLANLFPTIATGLGGLLPGELGATVVESVVSSLALL